MQFILRVALLCVSILQCEAKCSVSEQKCGSLCCCVTCKCLEGTPPQCEDMWGKPMDHVGTEEDERFASPEWSQRRHEEHLEKHREFIEEHKERNRLRRDEREAERAARKARGEPEDLDEHEGGTGAERGFPGHSKKRRHRGGHGRGPGDKFDPEDPMNHYPNLNMAAEFSEEKERLEAMMQDLGKPSLNGDGADKADKVEAMMQRHKDRLEKHKGLRDGHPAARKAPDEL